MKKSLITVLFAAGIIAADNNATDVKDEFAKKWAEMSAKVQQEQGAGSSLPALPPVPQVPEKSEEEIITSESRVFQEKLNIHNNKIKKEMVDTELESKGSIEIEPQFIEIAGKSEYYISYREFLEVRLFFANKQQNRYSLSQLPITSSELQNITQELQTIIQQETQSLGMNTSATAIIPAPPKQKKESLWLNKDYGNFVVASISSKSVVFKGK
ncbi:MAG: hypothetical protein QG567_844 [Campylobacterota bacterium]|nr:hypothetical protein [Campylobacterota bacterium]